MHEASLYPFCISRLRGLEGEKLHESLNETLNESLHESLHETLNETYNLSIAIARSFLRKELSRGYRLYLSSAGADD